MQRQLVLVVAAGLLVGADKPKTDKEQLQGTWAVVSAQYDGKAKDGAAQATFVFAGDRLTIKENDQTEEASYKLDPDKNPRTIDLRTSEGKEETARGIYLLDGDTLKLCWSLPGKDRPAKFESGRESGHTLVALKRVKP